MTETQTTLLSGFIGTIIGAIIGGISAYVGAVRISDRERRYKIFNDTAEALRNSLIKTQQRLISLNGAWSVIKEDFIIHDELRRRFELCLSSIPDVSFTEAWNNYKYWHDNIAQQTTSDVMWPDMHPLKDDPTFQQARKTKAYDLIQKIIEHTKHK